MTQTKFGMQQTLDGERMATLDPIDEAVSQLKTEQQAQAERQQREQERANVAGQPGQQTLKSVLVIKNPVSKPSGTSWSMTSSMSQTHSVSNTVKT